MNPRLDDLLNRIKALEAELEQEVAARQSELRCRIEDRRVRFEQEVLVRHRALKIGLLRYLAGTSWRHLASVPVIYAMLLPLLLLDAGVSLYQALRFPLYRMAKVKRGKYFVFDREQFAYLNRIERVNCGYCTYANGLLAYAREIVSRTEQYWCPIKHVRRVVGSHRHQTRFADFGDAEPCRQDLAGLRRALARLEP